jgi:hypothetical protein
MNDYREIRIDADLYDAAKEKFGKSFDTIDGLVAFLLRELVQGDTVDLDRADQQLVEERLRDLGYM